MNKPISVPTFSQSNPTTALLYQALQNIPKPIILLDESQTLYFYNRALKNFCRWIKGPAKLLSLSELQFPQLLEESIVSMLGGAEEVEVQTDLPNRGLRTLSITVSPLASQGRSISMVTIEDVTSVERLKTVRRDFIANVSHELRTPIMAVQGFVETLLDGAKDDPNECKRFLEIVSHQVNRLNELFDDLLELSRLEDGQTEVPKSPLALKSLVISARDALAEKALKQELSLECYQEQDGFLIFGNEPLLERAIENLLDNAIKYSPQKGTVTVTIGRELDKAFLTVADRGAGIAPEHKKRIFERFYRVDRSRSRKTPQAGSGLGLALVKHIVELHNGTVSVESSEGQGAAFTIILPIAEMLDSSLADNTIR